MSEAFSLKWENFQSNVSRSFGLLKHEVYLHDVMLIGDDHHQVCLDGVSADDLNNVMEYIYNGDDCIKQTLKDFWMLLRGLN